MLLQLYILSTRHCSGERIDVYILVATQFRSRDDSFGRVQLCNLSHTTDCMQVYMSGFMKTVSRLNQVVFFIVYF